MFPRGSNPPAVVGLDLGSNTFSCVLVEADEDGNPNVIDDASLAVRLSEGLGPGRPLSGAAVERGLEALKILAERFDMRARPVRAVATQALRMTSRPEDFTAPAEGIIGAPVEIVDGETEAVLAARGALPGLPQHDGPIAVIDVGGQSTEVCRRFALDAPWRPTSFPVGVVALKERFYDGDPPSDRAIERIVDHVRERVELPLVPAERVIAVAGTATSLAMLDLGISTWERELVHGRVMTLDSMRRWLDEMLGMTAAERSTRYGLGPARADVFPAGLATLLALMEKTRAGEVVVSANGMRVGAALSLLEE